MNFGKPPQRDKKYNEKKWKHVLLFYNFNLLYYCKYVIAIVSYSPDMADISILLNINASLCPEQTLSNADKWEIVIRDVSNIQNIYLCGLLQESYVTLCNISEGWVKQNIKY